MDVPSVHDVYDKGGAHVQGAVDDHVRLSLPSKFKSTTTCSVGLTAAGPMAGKLVLHQRAC